MFKIPEWGEDVPKSSLIFKKFGKNKPKELSTASSHKTHTPPSKQSDKKSVKNKKEKNNLPSPASNPKVKTKFQSNQTVTKPLTKAKNVPLKKDNTPNKKILGTVKKSQSKLNKKSSTNLDLNDLNTNKLDKVLINAKKRKFSEVFPKYETEDALCLDKQKPKKLKNSKPVQKNESQTKPVKSTIPSKINVQENSKKNKLKKKEQNQSDTVIVKKKEKLKTLLTSIRTPIAVKENNLRVRMLERLKAAQFRYLNEKLYTSSASDAQTLFQNDPMAFETYHQGYQQQVKKWPVKPLDVIVKKIVKMPKSYLVADMGCGEAALSKRVPQKVRSFDLVATVPEVEASDMAHTPLLSESVDVAVYCLALMGTDLTQYLCEANRVLKNGGHLLIAEVESRFEKVEDFIDEVQKLGFKLKNLDKSNTVFFFIEFTKVREPPAKKSKLPDLHLKPCLYKKR